MAKRSYKSHRLAELSGAYRLSFKEFVQKLRRLQSLESIPGKDEIGLAVASRELERARVVYYGKREALVQELLPSSEMRHPQVPTASSWGLAHA